MDESLSEKLLQIQQRGFDERYGGLYQVQQKMAEDISEIKGSIREAIKVLDYMAKDQERLRAELEKETAELKVKVSAVERQHQDCPARLRHNGWATSVKDLAFVIALIASFWALYRK